jgi:hypothetical protein
MADNRLLVALPVAIMRPLVHAAERTTLAAVDAVLASRVAEQAVDRIVSSELTQRAVSTALRGPLVASVGRDLIALADRPDTERLVGELIDSRLLDQIVERLLQSEELWLMVDEIARSPSVTDAISHQSIGFADQVAGVVRDHSRSADDRLERVARRLVRRRRPAVRPG